MALGDSGRAIGAVTRLLAARLGTKLPHVMVGKPELAADAGGNGECVNLFLYQIDFDASLRNVSLEENRPPPLWFSLRYLLTAFDEQRASDSPAAHEMLGRGLSALYELNFLQLDPFSDPAVVLALENCPEPLKITFDETPAELLSKIMQGTDEKYRLSVAFQVRPVMIVPAAVPSYNLLVGVDYRVNPPVEIDDDGLHGVHIAVLPTLGPLLDRVTPGAVRPGDELEIAGSGFTGDIHCWLGGIELPVLSQAVDRLRVKIDTVPAGGIVAGTAVSAGELALTVRQHVPLLNRDRTSNLLAVELLPVVATAQLAAATLTITGVLLGRPGDDIVVALYRDGDVIRVIEDAVPAAGQAKLTVMLQTPVAAGNCQVIVRINGRQARSSPTVAFP